MDHYLKTQALRTDVRVSNTHDTMTPHLNQLKHSELNNCRRGSSFKNRKRINNLRSVQPRLSGVGSAPIQPATTADG